MVFWTWYHVQLWYSWTYFGAHQCLWIALSYKVKHIVLFCNAWLNLTSERLSSSSSSRFPDRPDSLDCLDFIACVCMIFYMMLFFFTLDEVSGTLANNIALHLPFYFLPHILFMCAVFAFRFGRQLCLLWTPTLRIVARCIWVMQLWQPFLHESAVTTAHHLPTSSPVWSEPACLLATTAALWSVSFHIIIQIAYNSNWVHLHQISCKM